MDTRQLDALLSEDEGTALDFKRDQYPFEDATDEQKSEFLKDILAFANAWRRSNAYILVGVEEVKGGRSIPVGVRSHLDDANLQQFVNSKTNRKVDFRYECAVIDGVDIGVVCIPLQERPSYLTKRYAKLAENTVYIRRGSSTDTAKPDEIANMGEAREARKTDLAPRIVMEKQFLDLHFIWPHPAGLNGGPVFLARKHWQDKAPSTPLFSIQNFGTSPALDVTVVFELDDDNADLSVPSEWQEYGLSVSQSPPVGNAGVLSLMYGNSGGTGVGIPLYRRWACELPNLSPGSPRAVELPNFIANRLLLRGLQLGHLCYPGQNRELTMWARISCHSMDGEKHEAAFRWGVSPFSYGPAKPVEVYCNCRELPLLGGPPEPPVV
jgi:Putative DNA-binding domain